MAVPSEGLAALDRSPRSPREPLPVESLVQPVALVVMIGAAIGSAVALVAIEPAGTRSAFAAGAGLGAGGAFLLARRGRLRLASALLTGVLWAAVTGGIGFVGTLLSPAIGGYGIVVIVAGLLLGSASALWAVLLCAATSALLALAEAPDAQALSLRAHGLADVWAIQATLLAATGGLVYLAVRRVEESQASAETYAASLARRNRQLEMEARDRQRAESALRESEGRYRALIEHSEDVIAETDAKGRLLFANPSHVRTVGQPLDRVLGRTALEWVHPDDAPKLAAALGTLAERGAVRLEPLRYRRADGTWIWMESSAQTYRTGSGERRAVTVSRDVSDRRRAEERLRESEARFRALAESAWEIISEYDLDGKLLFVSPSVSRVLGFEPAELLARDPLGLVHPDHLDRARRTMREVFQAQRATEVSLRFRHKNGGWRWLEGSAQSFASVGGSQRVVVVARDATERRELVRKLLQSQKLEAVARLAGGIAHDFNNLLTVIAGNVELLLAQAELAPEQSEAVVQVSDAAERAASLVRQLMAFSRNQAAEPRVLDVNQVVRDMSRLLRRLIREDIELVTRPGPGPLCANVDPSQLEQIVANLAINARDAMPDSGRLVLETRASIDAEREWVVLDVSDTGAGMDAGTLAHIFEPFFSTKGPGQGTGLGLSTVYGIVEQSGGRVEVESEPGAGTRFRVFLPRVPPPAGERAA